MNKEQEKEQWDRYIAWRDSSNNAATAAGGVYSMEPKGNAPHMMKVSNPKHAAFFLGLLILVGAIGTIVAEFV